MTYRISKHQKSQARWFQQYSLMNSQHLNDDFHDMQTICKPKLSSANQNHPSVNIFPPYANPKISVIPKSFAKSWTVTAYFDGVIMCPAFLVQSVEVTSSGQKKFTLPKKSLHCLHYFAPRCTSFTFFTASKLDGKTTLRRTFLLQHDRQDRVRVSYSTALKRASGKRLYVNLT